MSLILEVEEMGTNFTGGGFWVGDMVDCQLNKVLSMNFMISTMIASFFLWVNKTNLGVLLDPSLACGDMGE